VSEGRGGEGEGEAWVLPSQPPPFPASRPSYWGDALKWGPDHLQPSAAACCDACARHEPDTAGGPRCTVWVWCGDAALCGPSTGQCWLKHLPWPEAVNPRVGADVPWTSGLASGATRPRAFAAAAIGGAERAYHVVITAAGPAVHWQVCGGRRGGKSMDRGGGESLLGRRPATPPPPPPRQSRVHYYHYVKQRAACRQRFGAACQMGGFTRILHSGARDDLATEIPTFVAAPLAAAGQSDDGYVVLNRPWAVAQWVRGVRVRERFVLMAEPDHLWLAPLPNPCPADGRPAAFPFFYIEPSKAEYRPLVERAAGRRLTLAEVESIPPIGSAPTVMATDALARLAPVWMNVSRAMFDDPPTRAAWGWVLEMYGFAVSTFLAADAAPPPPGSPRRAPMHLVPRLMVQPPWDAALDGAPILHYTYGADYALNGTATPGLVGEWRFDKRSYGGGGTRDGASGAPPRGLAAPPAAVAVAAPAVAALVAAINEATAAIPGWDEYVATGVAGEVWGGGQDGGGGRA